MSANRSTGLMAYLKRRFLNFLEIPEYQSLESQSLTVEESKEQENLELAHLKICFDSINGGPSSEHKSTDPNEPDRNWSLPLEIRKERRRVASSQPIHRNSIINLAQGTTPLDRIHDNFRDRCLSCSRPSTLANCSVCRNWQMHNRLHYAVSIIFGCGIAALFWYLTKDYHITLVTVLFGTMLSTLCYQTCIHPLERGV